MSSYLLLQLFTACLFHLNWMICMMGGKWPYSCCFVGAASKICSKQHVVSLCSSHLAFSLGVSLKSK